MLRCGSILNKVRDNAYWDFMKTTQLPKIALFIADLGGGGAERVFVNLAKAFSERGYPVDIVVGTLRGAAYLDDLPPQVRLVDLEISRMALGGPKLIKYFRRERPAVMLSTGDHSNCLVVLARRFARVDTRVVVRESNMIAHDLLTIKWFKRHVMACFIRYIYPRSDRVIAVSRGVARELNQSFGVPEKKLFVIYSPIVSDGLMSKAAAPLDHDWFKEGEPPVVLTVGRLTAQKSQETLIRAFARVREKINARLLILGEGEKRIELEALISRLGLAADVSLPGFKENPFAYMARAWLFVLPSAWEGLPGVLIQALGCGCPVVSTDCPSGPREILQDGRLGRLVPVGDDTAMAEAILESLQERRKSSCGSDGLEQFTVEYSTREYLKVLLCEGSDEDWSPERVVT